MYGPLLRDLRKYFGAAAEAAAVVDSDIPPIRVLVPGAGAARLAVEIANLPGAAR